MLAIVSAMPEEISAIVEALSGVTTHEFGRRQFHVGAFHGQEVAAVFSRCGKVAAAATVTQLIASFPVSELVFSGVAGGVRRDLSIGDIVIGTDLIQHDMDASPIFPRYEIPLLGKAYFNTDPQLRRRLAEAAQGFLADDLAGLVLPGELDFFAIRSPKVVQGVIASGDRFFAAAAEVERLSRDLPSVTCVEMEGAAVAQVCDEYSIPYAVVRTISDSADESAAHHFPRFAREIARHYSLGVLARFLRGV